MRLKIARRLLLVMACYGLLATAHAREPDWSLYDQLLERYVSADEYQGTALAWVDYEGLFQDPRFQQSLRQLSDFPMPRLESKRERLAFYINAYNLLTWKMLYNHWPVLSIKEAAPWYQSVWSLPVGYLGGEEVTLEQLEHAVLRPMGDPRVHFAIVCASISCPDLRRESYRAARLEEQLEDQSRRFLNNAGKGLRVDGKKVRISKIFKWFPEDFEGRGGVENFIRSYVELPKPISMVADLPYDWSLNGK
jgi:hypothetical protein